MATVDINSAAATAVTNPNASPRERAQQRLGQLVASLEAVASRLDSDSTASTSARSVLRTRFNDLQRQVNRLDGIVAGEGFGARGQAQVNAGMTGSASGGLGAVTSRADAPARAPTDRDRVEVAEENVAAAAPPAPPPAPVAATPVEGVDGVDLVA
jgi:hypothetical protein